MVSNFEVSVKVPQFRRFSIRPDQVLIPETVDLMRPIFPLGKIPQSDARGVKLSCCRLLI